MGMSPRARRGLRVLAGLAVGGLVALTVLTLCLLRDPLPRMEERRSRLAVVEEGPVSRADGTIVQPARLRAESGLTLDVLVRAPVTDAPDPSADRPTPGRDAPAREPGARGRDLAAPPRLPLYVLIGGYRTGERAALLVGETNGAVVAGLGYPYEGPVDLAGLEILPHLPAIRSALLDTPPAIQLALDYLLRRPDVDPGRVELVGVSFGAFFAPAAAALDPRVTRLWLVHGAARPHDVLDHGLERWIPHDLPRAAVAAVANVVFAGPQLAPERWLPGVSPRPVVVISARDDESLPRAAVEALYESARPPKERIWLEGRHVHPQRPDIIRRIMDVVLERAARIDAQR